jgi:cysteine-S-conjugate beta-lyase
MADKQKPGPFTLAAHAGFDPASHGGTVNPPVYHTSTVLFPTVELLESGNTKPFEGMRYGRTGTPTSHAFEAAVNALEGGHGAVVASSGLGACCATLMTWLKAGDHVLLTDSVYGPTRNFAVKVLGGYGVQVEFFEPTIGAGIRDLFRPNTKVVFLESPGSWSFEVQDVPAITEVSKARGITVMIDNSWATPIYFKPLDHGVDLSILAATKYIGGHSDAMLGITTAPDRKTYEKLKTGNFLMGQNAGSQELFHGLRGLRTLPLRLERHGRTGLELAEWLKARPEVQRVLHPALPGDPGHALWKRDFTGCTGLFGVLLKPYSRAAVTAMVEGMQLFKMGWSWGGYESLIVPGFHLPTRTATKWGDGVLLRIHAGLEDIDDMKADLVEAFGRLAAAA